MGVAVILYVSTVLGPTGFNFKPLPLSDAWQIFLDTPYVVLGSDQQPDWMANLLLLVPMGFLITGTIWPRRPSKLRWIAACFAFFVCLALVLAIKFTQLYFPPRTVTLNYIFAQSLGSLLGVALFGLLHRTLFAFARTILLGGRQALEITLAFYTVALFLFFLFPFDFALTAADLAARLDSLPRLFFAWPGEGRPIALRLVLLVASAAATVPLGMLIVARSRQISLRRAAALGFVLMLGVCAATTLVMSATPTLVAILSRTTGIVIGAAIMQRWNPNALSRWIAAVARAVPVLVPPYVLAVLFVNGLLATRWRSLDEAQAALDWYGLVPFWHYYIVPKAQAAASFVVHTLMFAPVGIMVWLRRGGGAGATWLAMSLAFVFAALVEFGRWLRPGLQPDISDAFVAAAAAGIAVKLMPVMLRMFSVAPAVARSPVVRGSIAETEPARPIGPQGREIGVPASTASYATAAVMLALDAAIVARYPLFPGMIATAVVLYGICLWRWTGAWLIVLPASLAVFDLTPWTGWMHVGESDLLILMTVAILAIRTPLRREDLAPTGLPGAVVALYTFALLVSLAIGLGLAGPAGGSDNPYLRPDNGLRLAKGLISALLLWPFLRQRLRTHGDTMVRFGGGMVAGLCLESLAVGVERALFPGLFDFASDYRVVGTFSSMHFGGGHVGAYLAMALPFLVVGLRRPRPARVLAVLAAAVVAGYALVVTFARTAYVAALIGMAVAVLGWAVSTGRARSARATAMALPVLLLALVGGIVVLAAFDSKFMEARVGTIAPDLGARERNWAGGLAFRDGTVESAVLGMGLGTYPRIALAHSAPTHGPSNIVVKHEGGAPYLSLTARSSFYLVQHVPIDTRLSHKLTVAVRSPDGASKIGVALCENMLLYSENCRGATLDVPAGMGWREVSVVLGTAGHDKTVLWGQLRRPVILSLYGPVPGSTIELRDVHLIDTRGRDVLANGNFGAGTERWLATDDDHLVWRMKSQYLMTLFEGGVLGLGAFLLLSGAALYGAMRAARGGDLAAAAVAGSLIAFLCSCAFDALLEAPRIATLFYLVALLGLDSLRHPDRRRKTSNSPG